MSFLLPPLPPTFEAALRDVRARSHAARVAAARRLGEPDAARETQARAGLVTLLQDPHLTVRAAALEGLEQVGDGSTWDAVVARLDDPSPLVRELAVLALAAVNHPGRPALLARLSRPDSDHPPAVRFQALAALLQHHAQEAFAVLLAATEDPDGRVRARAAQLLCGLIEGDAVGTTGAGPAWPGTDPRDGTRPPQLAPGDLPRLQQRLRALLDDALPEVRLEAALSLSRLGDAQALPPLRAALFAPSTRLDALEALGSYPAEVAGPAVQDVLAWGTRVLAPPYVNALAGRCLLRMGRADLARPCLQEALTAWRPSGRNLALECLGGLRAEQPESAALADLGPTLLRLATRPRGSDPEALAAAAHALAPVSPDAERAVSLLAARTKSPPAT